MNDTARHPLRSAAGVLAAVSHREHLDTDEQWQDCLDRVTRALEVPLPRLHRTLKLPPTVVASLLSSVLGVSRAYDRYLLPPLLADLSAEELESPEISTAAHEVLASWIAVLETRGPAAEEVAAHLSAELRWESLIDPGDWAPGDGAAVAGSTNWDRTARRVLATLPGEFSDAELDAILIGLWSGAAHRIRIGADWQTAAVWMDETDHAINAEHDLAAARAWTLATDGPLHRAMSPDEAAAVDAFLAWAYRRASTWPSFSTPDPIIHRRLSETRNGEDHDGAPSTDTAARSERWPNWVRTAVESRRFTPERVRRVISRQEPEKPEDILAELDHLEGLADVKESLQGLVAKVRHAQRRVEEGHAETVPELHLVLTGNPGTGKTTVARLYGRLLKSLGILRTGQFVEVVRSELVGPHLAESAGLMRSALESADGGVLFIDEAYALARPNDRAGLEVIDELVAQLEARRGSLAVVLAGYPGPMASLMDRNPGLRSRFVEPLLLPDLQNTALLKVFNRLASDAGYRLGPGVEDAVLARLYATPRDEGFGNAREVRKLFDEMKGSLARRFDADPETIDPDLIVAEDVARRLFGRKDDEAYAAAMDRLNRLVGLSLVKDRIQAMSAEVQFNLEMTANDGQLRANPIGHMVFAGNPGTGKTTVAAEFGAILASLGILRSGHVHTVTHADLIGEYLGQTAPKVRTAIRQALDGVLFVDEAYSLAPVTNNDMYTQEAVATLVEEMERNRERLVVILAGYPADMERLLSSNSGLRSRISATLDFEDFNLTELRRIAADMLTSQRLQATDEALDALADAAATQIGTDGFGNARTVQRLVAAARQQHAIRVQSGERTAVPDEERGVIVLEDVPSVTVAKKAPLGFHLA